MKIFRSWKIFALKKNSYYTDTYLNGFEWHEKYNVWRALMLVRGQTKIRNTIFNNEWRNPSKKSFGVPFTPANLTWTMSNIFFLSGNKLRSSSEPNRNPQDINYGNFFRQIAFCVLPVIIRNDMPFHFNYQKPVSSSNQKTILAHGSILKRLNGFRTQLFGS